MKSVNYRWALHFSLSDPRFVDYFLTSNNAVEGLRLGAGIDLRLASFFVAPLKVLFTSFAPGILR